MVSHFGALVTGLTSSGGCPLRCSLCLPFSFLPGHHFSQKGKSKALPWYTHFAETKKTSPRWLLEKDRVEDAGRSLIKLRGANSLEDVQSELDEIHANILWHREHSVTSSLVFFKEKVLWSRLWRAWTLAFLQQMSGAAGIRYYLPTNFIAAGTSEELSLLASGIDGTVQVGCTIGAMFFIDRIGRRHSLGVGAIIMAFCLMVCFSGASAASKKRVLTAMKINGALQMAYPNQVNKSANYVNIFFIFFFTVGCESPSDRVFGKGADQGHNQTAWVSVHVLGFMLVKFSPPIAVPKVLEFLNPGLPSDLSLLAKSGRLPLRTLDPASILSLCPSMCSPLLWFTLATLRQRKRHWRSSMRILASSTSTLRRRLHQSRCSKLYLSTSRRGQIRCE